MSCSRSQAAETIDCGTPFIGASVLTVNSRWRNPAARLPRKCSRAGTPTTRMARWPGNAGVHTGTAPRSGARRRNANREEARGRLGTPTSGRHARERETSADDAALGQLEFRTPFQSRMAQRCTPRICAVTLGPVCAMGDSSTAPFARLGRAVPAGGRRSKPSPRFCSGGDMRFRGAVAQRCRPEVGVPSRPCGSAQAAICGFAALSRSGAGRRPAFRHRLRGVTRVAHPPRG